MANSRQFLQNTFSSYAKGDMDAFFKNFDPNVQWTIHGETEFAGTYKNIDEVREAYSRFLSYLSEKPKQKLRYLIVEGNQAAVFLTDEVIAKKDKKKYSIDYWFMVHVSPDGSKITKIDNYMDALQFSHVLEAGSKAQKAA